MSTFVIRDPATDEAAVEAAQAEATAATLGSALGDASAFTAEILYAAPTAIDTLVLACAVSHDVDLFNSVPRLLFTSDEPKSGKTTALDIACMLAFNAWMADPTSFALRAKFNEPGRTTFVLDEISKIFGTSGLRGQANPLYRILVEGYRRTAKLSLAVDRTAVDVSSYSMAFCAGLGSAAPDDLRSRSIIFGMKPTPEHMPEMRSSVDFDTWAEGEIHNGQLHQAVIASAMEISAAYRSARPAHRKLKGRLGQIWNPLFAVASVAGGEWPQRCLDSFKTLALDASDRPVLSPVQMILRDAAGLFRQTGWDRMFASQVVAGLRTLDEELYHALPDRRFAQLLTAALGPTTAMTVDGLRARGFYATAVSTAWNALNAQLSAADTEPYEADQYDTMFDVTQTSQKEAAPPAESQKSQTVEAA